MADPLLSALARRGQGQGTSVDPMAIARALMANLGANTRQQGDPNLSLANMLGMPSFNDRMGSVNEALQSTFQNHGANPGMYGALKENMAQRGVGGADNPLVDLADMNPIPAVGFRAMAKATGLADDFIVSGRGDDLVTLYHGTDKAGYDAIRREGRVRGPVFLTPRRDVAEAYGGDEAHVIGVQVPASFLQVDFDLPGSQTLPFEGAVEYADKSWQTIHDALREGQSVATLKDILIDRGR